jgi:pimeloyl-ACP methyl ester carboxylesterase
VTTAAAALLTVIALPATAAAAQTPVCRDVKVPVTLVPGTPADQTIYGQLCSPAGGPSKVLQVLVHGVTYDHHYWDLPGFGGRYSYVRYMAAAGYSTLAIDRIGSGRSSHPPGALITAVSNADVLHQAPEESWRRGQP